MTRDLLESVVRRAEALATGAGTPDAELVRRFAAGRAEAAFAELVRRHGPMVWAACRQSLTNPADAEDAFQATFLALVRQAGSIRAGAAVGGWLHGVAVRTAGKVRRAAGRRTARERRAAKPEGDRPVPESGWHDLLAAVHEEVQRLPPGLRAAFVLCELEGVRQPDAASRLGWKAGTLTGRLARARRVLLDRLAARGLAPSAAAGAAGVAAATADAGVPPNLVETVLAWAAGNPAPPAVLKLVLEVTPMANGMKLLAAAVLAAGGLAAGFGSVLFSGAEAQTPPATAKRPPDPKPKVTPAPGGALPAPGLPGGEGGAGLPAAAPPYPVPAPAATGGSTRPAAAPRWEYSVTPKPATSAAFLTMLDKRGADGWEYGGVVDFADTGAPLVVFKRVVSGGRVTGVSAADPFGPPAAATFTGRFVPSGVTARPAGEGGRPLGRAGDPLAPAPGGANVIDRPTPGGPPPAAGADIHVVRLQHAEVLGLLQTVNALLENEPGVQKLLPDERTNSFVVKGTADGLRAVRAIVEKLDVPAADGAPTGGAFTPGGGRPPTRPGGPGRP